MTSVVCYHYPCPDGIFAALAAHIAHKKSGREEQAGRLPLQAFFGSETVYFLDYTGPAGFPEAVAKHAQRVVVLDHHKTAQESLCGRTDLPANMDVVIDMDRSGAVIARDHFSDIQPLGDDLNTRFDYIQDADLWQWKLQDSKAFHCGLGSLQMEYDANVNPAIFETLQRLTCAEIIAKGKVELERQAALLQDAMRHKYVVQLGGVAGVEKGWGRCLAVFTGDTAAPDALASVRSALGNLLAEASAAEGLEPIGVVAYEEAGIGDSSKVKVSLRGVGNTVDTTIVSKAYGGGGHAKASSSIMPREDFVSWRK